MNGAAVFRKAAKWQTGFVQSTTGKFTFCDMTDVEAIDYGGSRWGEATQSRVFEAVEDRPPGEEERAAGGLSRSNSAPTAIATLHGMDGIERALSLVGASARPLFGQRS